MTSIEAHELQTFLRVGATPQEPQGITTFDIEWIPDLLPKTKIGELRSTNGNGMKLMDFDSRKETLKDNNYYRRIIFFRNAQVSLSKLSNRKVFSILK